MVVSKEQLIENCSQKFLVEGFVLALEDSHKLESSEVLLQSRKRVCVDLEKDQRYVEFM